MGSIKDSWTTLQQALKLMISNLFVIPKSQHKEKPEKNKRYGTEPQKRTKMLMCPIICNMGGPTKFQICPRSMQLFWEKMVGRQPFWLKKLPQMETIGRHFWLHI